MTQNDTTSNNYTRVAFELNVLNETIAFAQDYLATHDISPARGEQLLAKYQTRIHQLSTFITNERQRQKLRDLETKRQHLIETYQAQVTEIIQEIRNLKNTIQSNNATQSVQETTALQASLPESPRAHEPKKPFKRSRFRLFRKRKAS